MSAAKEAQRRLDSKARDTRLLPVDANRIGRFTFKNVAGSLLEDWDLEAQHDTPDLRNLQLAAAKLRDENIPVAFPTETVYGLGADATRSAAVRGIYEAKQRPSDNPLIVHVCSLQQLRTLLKPFGRDGASEHSDTGPSLTRDNQDPIPDIYKPLINKFWPGPLTVILPTPSDSVLAPEVTAGLSTFGARMPRNLLALALIKLANVPLAAPSANASTKPSPTAAEHVKHDLDGRIELIIDGGPCDVGVESTVVDGLSYPPSILRPGGISIEQLRQCPGWQDVVIGYKDVSEKGLQPRAPGMKYRHYSPRATVVLYEARTGQPSSEDIVSRLGARKTIGIIRTKAWPTACALAVLEKPNTDHANGGEKHTVHPPASSAALQITNGTAMPIGADLPFLPGFPNLVRSFETHRIPSAHYFSIETNSVGGNADLWEVDLGCDTEGIARGLFSAMRELDRKNVETIFVEGIDDSEGVVAAAVMNRLRKAAEVHVSH